MPNEQIETINKIKEHIEKIKNPNNLIIRFESTFFQHTGDNAQGRISRQLITTQHHYSVTNFIRPYLHQFSINSHGLNGYRKPLKRPFDRYQSRLEAINNGRDIRQINW